MPPGGTSNITRDRCLSGAQVPACYLHAPPRLQPGYFAKFQQDTLFYIFYSMPGDEAQLLAADELSARQWWFHKVIHETALCEILVEPLVATARPLVSAQEASPELLTSITSAAAFWCAADAIRTSTTLCLPLDAPRPHNATGCQCHRMSMSQDARFLTQITRLSTGVQAVADAHPEHGTHHEDGPL